MKRPVASSLLAFGLFSSTLRANAQEPSHAFSPPRLAVFAPIPPLVAPSLLPPGEPAGTGGDLSPFFASQPLRLSLTSTIFPVAGSYEQCRTREEASGNSINGQPIQRYQFVRLTPHLVLNGFSSAGCPIDGGIGAGATYTEPLLPSLWVVASAGYYGIPGRNGIVPPRMAAEARVDLVKVTKSSHVLRIGVEHKVGTGVGGVPAMITFGEGF